MLPMFISFPKGFFTTLIALSAFGVLAAFALFVFTVFKAVTVGGLWLFFAGAWIAALTVLFIVDRAQ